MIPLTLPIIEFVTAVLFVLVLSVLAEYVSPKVSGVISGIPTGTAIILFFYGLEHGTKFASESSLFNLAGMASFQIFIYLYYRVSMRQSKHGFFLPSLAAIIGYLATILLLKQVHLNFLIALAIPLFFIPLFAYLFKEVGDTTIEKRVKLSPKIITIRAIIASLVILSITSIAKLVGSEWAGLLSVFPTTVFPLLLIIHTTYGKNHVHTIIKNIPNGQWAMVIYVTSVFFLYPLLGIYVGTLLSYLFVAIYLVIFFRIQKRVKNSSRKKRITN